MRSPERWIGLYHSNKNFANLDASIEADINATFKDQTASWRLLID
jgi:hypothetical protein